MQLRRLCPFTEIMSTVCRLEAAIRCGSSGGGSHLLSAKNKERKANRNTNINNSRVDQQ